jgi:hypothetical protein
MNFLYIFRTTAYFQIITAAICNVCNHDTFIRVTLVAVNFTIFFIVLNIDTDGDAECRICKAKFPPV